MGEDHQSTCQLEDFTPLEKHTLHDSHGVVMGFDSPDDGAEFIEAPPHDKS